MGCCLRGDGGAAVHTRPVGTISKPLQRSVRVGQRLFRTAEQRRDPGPLVPDRGSLGIVLVVKPLATYGVALLLRSGAETAVTVAIALAQIGEFSFILAGLARRLGVLPEQAAPAGAGQPADT